MNPSDNDATSGDVTAADVTAADDKLGAALPSGWLGVLATIAMASGPAMTGMMLTIVLPILPEMAKDVVGGRDTLIAMPTLGIVVGGIIAGLMIDRMSTRTLMLRMVVAFGIVGVAGMLLDGVPLLISRFLMGVISTCISASSTTLIGEHIYLNKRPRVLGFQMAGGSLAGIVAMKASALLTDDFGWRASFILFPLIAGIVLAAAFALVPASSKPLAAEAHASDGGTERLVAPLRTTGRVLASMWPLYLVLLLMHATAYTSNSQSSFVLADNGVTTASDRADMIAVGHLMIVSAALLYPFTRRLLGSRWIPAFFLMLMTSGLILLGLSDNLVLAGIALGLLGFGNGTLFPHQSNLILARAAPEYRGRAVGLMVSNQFLADSINPYIFKFALIPTFGLHHGIALIGLFAGVGMLGALIYGSRASNMPMPATAGYGH